MDPKSKKPNVVSTEEFNEISEQVKRSIELAVQLSNSFQFTEPIPVDSQLSNNSDHNFGISKFEFCGPFEQQSDEKNDTLAELVARLARFNIRCDQLDCSAQLDVSSNLGSKYGNDNFQDASHSIKLECPLQQYVENNSVARDGNENCEINYGESKDTSEQWSNQLNCPGQTDVAINENPNGTGQNNQLSSQLNCSASTNEISNYDKDSSHKSSIHTDYPLQEDVRMNVVLNDGNDNFDKSSNQLNYSVQEDVPSVDTSRDGNYHCETHVGESKGTSRSNQSSNQLNYSVQEDVPSIDTSRDGNDHCETDVGESKGTGRSNQSSNQLNYSVQEDVISIDILMDGNDHCETHVGESKSTSQNGQSSSQLNSSAQSGVPMNDIPNNSNENSETHVGESKDESKSSQSNNQLNSSMQQDVTMHEISNDGNDNFEMDSHRSHECSNRLDGPLQQHIDNNSLSMGEIGDNIQTDVGKLTGIDRDTQITHVDVDSNEQNRPPPKQYDNQPLPFLIEHIHRITWPRQDEVCFVPVMELFGQTFNTVMVYGMVTSLTVADGGLTQRFVIDDGSGSVNVTWKANKQLIELIHNVKHLNDEVKSCRESGLSAMDENGHPDNKKCKEVLDSLNQILFYVKREATKRSRLKLFGHAAVVGKPMRPPGKGIVILHSNQVVDDSGVDRSLELYHKKNLIRLYEKKYKL